MEDVSPEEQGFHLQFRNRLFNIDDTTLLHELDGLVSGSFFYAFKRTVVADAMVNEMRALGLAGDSVGRSDELVVGAYDICFTFDCGMVIRMYETSPLTQICEMITKLGTFLNSDFPTCEPRGLTFQFRDKVLYSTSARVGAGFSDYSVLRDISGLVNDCCIYVYESIP